MRHRQTAMAWVALAGLVILSGCSKDKPASPPPKTGPEQQVEFKSSDLSSPPSATDAMDEVHVKQVQKLVNDGLAYLLKHRDDKGVWNLGGGAMRPAATAMVLKTLLQHPDFNADHPVVKNGFDILLGYRQKDGGIYEPGGGAANYTTSLAVMAMAAAADPRFNEPMQDAMNYLRGLIIRVGSKDAKGRDVTDEHPMRGGVGYGERGRPDLSNVGMWVEAMHDAGVAGDDPDMQAVLGFVTRTQNFTETNRSAWALVGANAGGFIYAPATGDDLSMGESKAGAGPGGKGLRSYGSMTYIGFKSMLYANVDRSDKRVTAAFTWIRDYWRLDSNPNMPQEQSLQGLYYYYHVFAKALRVWGQPDITDLKGGKHNWRHELIEALAERVAEDGSWRNTDPTWGENNPVLVTAYVVLALQETLKK